MNDADVAKALAALSFHLKQLNHAGVVRTEVPPCLTWSGDVYTEAQPCGPIGQTNPLTQST